MTSAPQILGPKDPRWFMDLEDVPESHLHAATIQLLMLILGHRFRDALVTTNLPCRWDPNDERVGVNPDVILVDPHPPVPVGATEIDALRVWRSDNRPPRLAIEVVSKTNTLKDYRDGPARHERLGTQELWLFDPELCGPNLDALGGPYSLQIWRGRERLYAGDGPAYSPALDAWAVVTDAGQRLRMAEDDAGTQLWPTRAEAADLRADAEAARATAEAEARVAADEARAAADEARAAAEAEVRRLRALLENKS